MRPNTRTLALVAALASTTALTACQDARAPRAASSPTTAGVTSSPAAQSDPGGTTPTTATADGKPVGPDGADAGRREVLTAHGGWVVQGSRITFVYRNGMRHRVDVGQEIPNGSTTVRTSDGVLTVNDNTATWATRRGATTVNRQGAGAVADASGVIVVTGDGSTTCANSKGLQWVGSDGSKGAADKNGTFYSDKDGRSVRLGRSPKADRLAGRFTVCNVGNTSSVDLYSDVLFRFDSAELTPAGRAVVASAARTIRTSVQGKPVNLVGHTDSVGDAASNRRLGQRRADAVAKQLRKDLPEVDLRVRSAGETEPVAANIVDGKDNPQGRAQNRRVTITWQK